GYADAFPGSAARARRGSLLHPRVRRGFLFKEAFGGCVGTSFDGVDDGEVSISHELDDGGGGGPDGLSLGQATLLSASLAFCFLYFSTQLQNTPHATIPPTIPPSTPPNT
ncbi:hypothetical protein O988_05547, partial [Pseudogymnoascus sp. VKM F-3808]